MTRLTKLAAAALLGAAGLAAQDLQLDVRGGSMPGTIAVDTYPASVPLELMIVLLSTFSGPTPCQLFDPNDPRELSVGLELLDLSYVNFADLDDHMRFSIPLGSVPALQDRALFLQSVTLNFAPTLLGRISNGNVVRLGNAGSFRDRLVSFPNERAFATVLPRADRKWLLVGGARGGLLSQVATATTAIYDPMADAFAPGPTLSAPRSLHTATQLPNGTWLIAGGVNGTNDPQATCEIYDPTTDTFTTVATMNSARTGHSATLLANGKVLVAGGIQAMPVTPTQLQPIREIVNTTELYDPVADTWTNGPLLSTPRAGHVAIVRPDGKVLLAGGISWDTNIVFSWLPAVRRSCDLYNPVTNTIGSAPQMAVARSLIDPIDLGNDKWLVAGGINGITIIPFNPGNPTNTAEVYDAVANTWTTVGALATARGNHKGWALGNGQFLLSGGANGSILSPTPLSSTEIFSTATNTFSAGPAMTSARAGAAAYATPQGQIMLFGGATTGGLISNTCEWYYF